MHATWIFVYMTLKSEITFDLTAPLEAAPLCRPVLARSGILGDRSSKIKILAPPTLLRAGSSRSIRMIDALHHAF